MRTDSTMHAFPHDSENFDVACPTCGETFLCWTLGYHVRVCKGRPMSKLVPTGDAHRDRLIAARLGVHSEER